MAFRWLSTWPAWMSTTPTAWWDTTVNTWAVRQLQVQHIWQHTSGNELTYPRNIVMPITHKGEGKLSRRNVWMWPSVRHFLMQRRRRRRWVWWRMVWQTTTTSLSLSSLPMLPLFVSSMAMFLQISMLAFRTFRYKSQDNRVQRPRVRTKHLFLYLACM